MSFKVDDAVTSEVHGSGTIVYIADGSDAGIIYPDGYPVAAAFDGSPYILSFETDGTPVFFGGWYTEEGVSYDLYWRKFGVEPKTPDKLTRA